MNYTPPDPNEKDETLEVLGDLFDLPEQDWDNQFVEISSVQNPTSEEGSSNTSKIEQTPIENSDMASDLGDLF